MMVQTNTQKPCCGDGSSSTAPCGSSDATGLERTRFFPRQLVTPDDLTQDQIYFRDKARRHNRMLHGWGVVCGARCHFKSGDCSVIIEPGYILGPYGDEIVISGNQIIDICKQNLNGDTFSGCGDFSDPWCKDVRASRKTGQIYYLAIRYDECQNRPVSVPGGDCGCGDGGCEYTRIRDSYTIQVLDELPDNYKLAGARPNIQDAIECDPNNRGRACPPCPSDPWVILADFTLAADGTIATLDCFSHRRFVASFANYFFTCADPANGLRDVAQMGMVGARNGLMDIKAERSSAAPNQTVAVKLADRSWSIMPINFTVKPGDTLRSLLATEGDRPYLDPTSGETTTLRELYALAGANPDMMVNSIEEAVHPLEGLSLDVSGLRVVQGSLSNLLDPSGMQKLHSEAIGNPGVAPDMTATALKGVDAKSRVGKELAGQSIASVAAVTQDEFIKKSTAGIPQKQLTAATAQAREVWTNASRVVSLANAWKKG